MFFPHTSVGIQDAVVIRIAREEYAELGVQREESARFSFLLSIPAILGAFLLHLDDLAGADISHAVGAGAAALVGLLAIHLTITAVISNKLWIFSAYLFVVAIAVSALNFLL